jgi:hypothetical protein
MTQFYDARGNIYGVISPEALRAAGIDLPISATHRRPGVRARGRTDGVFRHQCQCGGLCGVGGGLGGGR